MGQIKLGNITANNVKLGSLQVQKVYLGSNLVWSYTNYSSELQAIINRANAEGFTLPSSTTLGHIDALISAYKSSGVWTKMDRLYNFAYNNTALTNFARIDWKNPSTSPLIIFNGGITYVVSGFMGNGVDGYLNTHFTPSTDGVNYTQNNASRTALVYNTPTTGNAIDGNTPAGNNGFFIASTSAHRINGTNNIVGGNVNLGGVGLKSINRYNATDLRLYNRTTENIRTSTSTILPPVEQYIFRNVGNYSNSEISNYMLGSSLTLTEVTAIRNDYNTYLSNIGLTPITLT